MVAERDVLLLPQERLPERTCEQIGIVPVPQVVEQVIGVPKTSSQDRMLQGTVEQILDVPVPEMVEQLVKLPKTVSEDGIQQQTVERIADIPVPQVVEELVEVFKLQIVEKIDEKTVEVSQAQFLGKTVDTPVGMQRQVPIIQTVQKNMEVSPLQFMDISCRGAETDPPESECSGYHRSLPVATHWKGDWCPCCVGRARSTGAGVQVERRKQHSAHSLPLPNRKRNNCSSSSNRSSAHAVPHTDTTAMVDNEALYDICHRHVDFSSLSMRMMKYWSPSSTTSMATVIRSATTSRSCVPCRMRSLLYMESFRWQPLRVSCLR